MPKDYPRADRVERLAREVLGEAIGALRDPRVGFATVTGVKMSADLRTATVFVSVLGDEEQREQSMKAIQHATPHLRSVMGREIRMKYLPRLEVVEDQTAIVGERIEAILREVGVSKPPQAAQPSEGPEIQQKEEEDG